MVRDFSPETETFRQDVLRGLRLPSKRIPCKYLYDERGSQLFEQICQLEEYYPTRAELDIMREHAAEMAAYCGERGLLIEYGSGSSLKTRLLLDQLRSLVGYVPIDIALEQLQRSAAALRREYPDLRVLPVCADYTSEYEIPELSEEVGRRIVYFPGSTIGNFTSAEAIVFLKHVASTCGAGGALLIGVDLVKDPELLERAYDDSKGITRAFIRNALVRINRELDADFVLERFEYYAEYNDTYARVEMGLTSSGAHVVNVGSEKIRLGRGESIHIENSHKYSLSDFAELAASAGLRVERVWTDSDARFSVQYLTMG